MAAEDSTLIAADAACWQFPPKPQI